MEILNMVALGLLVTFVAANLVGMRRSSQPHRSLRAFVRQLIGINGLVVLASLGVALLTLASPAPVLAQGTTATSSAEGGIAIGAALATGLASVGAGIGVGIAGAAAIGTITEKPEMLGRTLIFVGLAEGVAIYGLIISFMLLGR